ncbi:MAG: helix-turn-helix transcriptional regulator [Acidaminococcus sp.]|jgi:DNA-binding XRE family transcriptional regulator|nr:helix-turn-helix transcriptional regulator [Acidaminococcus sp.]MCI2114232.1 helix-turn-helix transcriptional regulator [Acidaminococcus sp.]MCI2116167.1 helix-turn-helix transcriptional regulator [Acidaminococcus sp.]
MDDVEPGKDAASTGRESGTAETAEKAMGDKKKILCQFIGAKVRYYRMLCGIDSEGLSQAELGERAHLHPDTISRIERGTYNDSVPLSTLVDVAEALGVDVLDLVSMTDLEKRLIHWE